MSPLLEASGVWKTFEGRGRPIVACRDVSFAVEAGEVVGLVGESGSGKSTMANLVLGLLPPARGEIRIDGESIAGRSRRREKELRARVQAVFQEPLLALDSRRTIGWSVAEPLRIHGRGGRRARKTRALELLSAVGLDTVVASRRPSELSGGQLQRANIARAIALDPELLVCDEPVSALDVSVQAQILNLFLEVQQSLGVAMLFISHDLAVVRHICDRLLVMYAGRVVEDGLTEAVCGEPRHPYTRALLDASLEPDPEQRPVETATVLREGVPETGCPFVPRCPLAEQACSTWEPELLDVGAAHRSACRRHEVFASADEGYAGAHGV